MLGSDRVKQFENWTFGIFIKIPCLGKHSETDEKPTLARTKRMMYTNSLW